MLRHISRVNNLDLIPLFSHPRDPAVKLNARYRIVAGMFRVVALLEVNHEVKLRIGWQISVAHF